MPRAGLHQRPVALRQQRRVPHQHVVRRREPVGCLRRGGLVLRGRLARHASRQGCGHGQHRSQARQPFRVRDGLRLPDANHRTLQNAAGGRDHGHVQQQGNLLVPDVQGRHDGRRPPILAVLFAPTDCRSRGNGGRCHDDGRSRSTAASRRHGVHRKCRRWTRRLLQRQNSQRVHARWQGWRVCQVGIGRSHGRRQQIGRHGEDAEQRRCHR
mmetsp:Transcript_5278/g.15435  ORF Transcript_5278/g.15435 Transcript_5278/m.15435 type:complete len:212 (-) Transcript_5278:2479-3114(-)